MEEVGDSQAGYVYGRRKVMAGITIKEYGLTFVWACLREYLGRSWPILLIFAAGIVAGILFSVFKKEKEAELEVVDAREYVPEKYEDSPLPDASSVTWMFLSIVLFCLVTVMNPFLVRYLIPKFGMTTVYYRFFWILPITFGAAYWLARAVGSVRRKVLQAGAFALIAAGLAKITSISIIPFLFYPFLLLVSVLVPTPTIPPRPIRSSLSSMPAPTRLHRLRAARATTVLILSSDS